MPKTVANPISATRMPARILTTGDISAAFNTAPRTVALWIDKGQLKGYRLPGSRDRRAALADVLEFARLHGMPTNHPLLATDEPTAATNSI